MARLWISGAHHDDCGPHCYGIELSPEYCALAIARWEQLTGRKGQTDFESRESGVGRRTGGVGAAARRTYPGTDWELSRKASSALAANRTSTLDIGMSAKGPRTDMHRSRKFYSITLSARMSNEGGTVRPSAFAVFTLITSSNLVGLSTGRSEGLVPLSILST